VSAFEKWFETQWPQYAATVKMYQEKSPAVDYMDAMIPLRTKHAAQKAWNAALEHAAKVCEKTSHRDDDMGAIHAAEIRKEIEK